MLVKQLLLLEFVSLSFLSTSILMC